MQKFGLTLLFLLIIVFNDVPLEAGKGVTNLQKQDTDVELVQIAETDYQWTGIAISESGRIFVNFPRWSPEVPISVAEIINGKTVAYPDKQWNKWDAHKTEDNSFVCVQSVFIDDEDFLWVLDPANPFFRGVIDSGPKLHKFELKKNSLVRTFTFDSKSYVSNSYFNDVRIDTEKNIAYITDSGAGAIIVVNLETGNSRRLLSGHHSTKAERDYITISGSKLPNFVVHSDGIELSPDNKYLYYIALTADHLYRVPTENLLDNTLADKQLADKVEKVYKTGVTDGILFDKNDNLYLGGLESNSINTFSYPDNFKTLITDDMIKWADSFARDSDGTMYFTTSQIHIPPPQRGKYKIYKIIMK